jgi:hypothetical protein
MTIPQNSVLRSRQIEAEARARDEAAAEAARPFEGWVEKYVLQFKMTGLMEILQRVGLWGNDTVHGMRGTYKPRS